MKNIELIDKAIDKFKGVWPKAEFDGVDTDKWQEAILLCLAPATDVGARIGEIHCGSTGCDSHYFEVVCTSAEFEARKTERQNKPDWKDAPDWAQYLAQNNIGDWWWYPQHQNKPKEGVGCFQNKAKDCCEKAGNGEVIGRWQDALEQRPSVAEPEWPDEERIDIIGPNGNDGLHYAAEAPEFKHGAGVFNLADDSPRTASDYLAACAKVQLERSKQYDTSGTGERSFDAAAEAFNCVTGKNLRGSDVCLILEMVKLVRQYSDQTRLHADSVLDAVSYGSLWAAEITAELGE